MVTYLDGRWEANERSRKLRDGAGHARHAHPADSDHRAGARAHHRTCDRAYVGERAGGRAGIALSRAAPAGASRLGRIVLGRERKQSQSEILQADGSWQEATYG